MPGGIKNNPDPIATQGTMVTIHPYPGNARFAFSIVHDADAAYSGRLTPLLADFEKLCIPITLTVFTHWASWAHNGAIWHEWETGDIETRWLKPESVPLTDPEEARFYRQALARGHEIAMHSASETSNTRRQLKTAFGDFRRLTGIAPRMYVEHSCTNNADTQVQQGSDPASPYYNSDLLRDSGCWVWVDHAPATCPADRCTDVLDTRDGLLDEEACARYGINKAFVRSGLIQHGDGDGFLRAYTPEAVANLASNGGTALVYTHLNFGWLDTERRRMRADIRTRLRAIIASGAWMATASDVLDRHAAMKLLELRQHPDRVEVVNHSTLSISDVTLRVPTSTSEASLAHEGETPRVEGFFHLGDIPAGEKRSLYLPV